MTMKKKYNRIKIVVLLSVLICFSVVGCRNKDSNKSKGETHGDETEIILDNNVDSDEQGMETQDENETSDSPNVSSKKENKTTNNNTKTEDVKEDGLSGGGDSNSESDSLDNTESEEPSDSTQSKDSSKLEESEESTNEAWGPILIY